MPLESYDGVGCTEYQFVYAYSEQVTKDVIQAGGGSRATSSNNYAEDPESCNPEGRQVVSGEPVGYENLLVRENATGTYQLVNVPPPGVTPADAHFQAASADLSHVIFTETSPLAAGARYGVENLYEWDEGALRLVSVLPDGTTVPGSFAAKADTREHENVVSGDGSHVLFTYGGALYDRIGGQRTVEIDEQQGGPGTSGGGSFKSATADGSKVFFLDESKLTAGSTAEAGEPDLYECALPEGASKCELTDLTVAAGANTPTCSASRRSAPTTAPTSTSSPRACWRPTRGNSRTAKARPSSKARKPGRKTCICGTAKRRRSSPAASNTARVRHRTGLARRQVARVRIEKEPDRL